MLKVEYIQMPLNVAFANNPSDTRYTINDNNEPVTTYQKLSRRLWTIEVQDNHYYLRKWNDRRLLVKASPFFKVYQVKKARYIPNGEAEQTT